MTDARYKAGVEQLIKWHGERGVKAVEGYKEGSNALGKYVVEFAYGDIYSRPGLEPKQRSIVTISNLIALGGCDEELYYHLHGALNVGLTSTEIEEVILQSAVYCGFHRAINALTVMKNVLDERENQS